MAKITGSFEYNSDDRSLVFIFDEESKKYLGKCPTLPVEPQVDKACGVWHDKDSKPMPSIPAIYLTFSPEFKHNGLLVNVVASETLASYRERRLIGRKCP